jgi:sugar lactone lactonase YvrE
MTTTLAATVLAEGRYFCEAPRWHDGRFWFSDFYAHEVCSVALDGDVRVELKIDDQPSGLGWLLDGRLLVVAMIARQVLRREHDGSIVTHADLNEVATFLANDMIVDETGQAYVGNFGFDLHAYLNEHGIEALFGELFTDPSPFMASLGFVTPTGEVTVAADSLLFPNGMVLLEDGNTLVVAQTLGMELTAFDRAADGTLSNRRAWASLVAADGSMVVPDGIAADRLGGIWVANALAPEVVRVEPGGEITHRITTSQTAFACAVGGPEGRHVLACTAPTSDDTLAAATRNGRLEIVDI